MTLFSVFLMAVLSRPSVTTTAIVMTPRTTAYSAMVWPASSCRVSTVSFRYSIMRFLPGWSPWGRLPPGAVSASGDAVLSGIASTCRKSPFGWSRGAIMGARPGPRDGAGEPVRSALGPGLERGDDVVQQVLDGGAEQAQRDHHRDGDDAEDDGVLGHRLPGVVAHVGLKAADEVGQGIHLLRR